MGGTTGPFALGSGPDACLLLHGLTGSPAEVRPVGEALAAAGFRAVGPLLPGHGTSPRDLATKTRADMVAAARAALLELRGARSIALCGLSMGGLLALQLAATNWPREGLPAIGALALLAPAIEFTGLTWVFANVVGRLPPLPFMLAKGGRDIQHKPDVDERAEQVPDGSYQAIPLRWGRELRLLRDETVKLLPLVHAPALVLHGRRDRTVAASGARAVAAALHAELRILERSGHVLPLDQEADSVCTAVRTFFETRIRRA